MLVNAPGVVNTNRINGVPFLVDTSISSNVSLAFLNGSAIDGESWSTFIGGGGYAWSSGENGLSTDSQTSRENNTGVVEFQGNSHSFRVTIRSSWVDLFATVLLAI